jgi:hypothetical protein
MNVSINGKKVENTQLITLLESVFVPNTASASFSGFDRGELAKFTLQNLAQLGKIDSVVLSDEESIIEVDGNNIPLILESVVSGTAKNKAYREAVETENLLYKNSRKVTILKVSDGQRGRKAMSVESRFAGAFG